MRREEDAETGHISSYKTKAFMLMGQSGMQVISVYMQVYASTCKPTTLDVLCLLLKALRKTHEDARLMLLHVLHPCLQQQATDSIYEIMGQSGMRVISMYMQSSLKPTTLDVLYLLLKAMMQPMKLQD